jgi:L-histidine Nalpha-methyltransferase
MTTPLDQHTATTGDSPAGAAAGRDTTRDAMRDAMRRQVWQSLRAPQKWLPSTYFYDRRGSELFEHITRLPEYYPTRVETEILRTRASELLAETAPAVIAELGAGSARKTRLLLAPWTASQPRPLYIPMDVSRDFLAQTARQLCAEFPTLRVDPVVADFTGPLQLPEGLPAPLLLAFLGSTIGNFEPADATALLARMAALLSPATDAILLGVDLRKDPRVLHAAYDDAQGVTAEFNLNVLRVLNRQLGADFDLAAFSHQARYDSVLHRVEMHLESRRHQVVHIPGAGEIAFQPGETILTEISCKYDRTALAELAALAGLTVARWYTDDGSRFALALLRRVAAGPEGHADPADPADPAGTR